jgi:hypothetical protein
MGKKDDVEKLLKDVKYFDGKTYYKIDCVSESKKLINNNLNKFKKFIVVNVRDGLIHRQDELEEIFNCTNKMAILTEHLNNIKYKVYKQIGKE